MPITEKQIEESGAPIAFERPGHAHVIVGPCTANSWRGSTIPRDGRHYTCAGRITFRDGTEVRAHLWIATHTFDYLEGARCHLGGTWYDVEEPELYEALGVAKEEARPFTWQPDIPLEGEPGPHPEEWASESLDERGSA